MVIKPSGTTSRRGRRPLDRRGVVKIVPGMMRSTPDAMVDIGDVEDRWMWRYGRSLRYELRVGTVLHMNHCFYKGRYKPALSGHQLYNSATSMLTDAT